MKFLIKTVFYSVFLSIIIIACCKKRNYDFLLSDEDLKWNPYFQGQNISFKSNMQDTESFEVSEVKRFSGHESEECMDIIREELSVTFYNKSKGNRGKFMEIKATFDGSPASARIFWGYPLETPYNYLPPESPSTSIVINGTTFNNVYEIIKENVPVDSAVVKYYFNKDYGLLKYVLKNGNYYVLIK